MERQRIYNLLGKANDETRTKLVELLAICGYAVKIGRERQGSKGAYQYFVEYWTEEEEQ